MAHFLFHLATLLFLVFVWKSSRVLTQGDDPGTDECTNNGQCKGQFKICRQGICMCKEDYVDSNGKCLKAPTIGEKCALDDGSILDCKGPGVSASCPEDGPNKDRCSCMEGYEAAGKICKFKDRGFNEKCSADSDCGLGFSSCQSGTCKCITGLKFDNGKCTSDPKCPSGEVVKEKDGKVKLCELKEVTKQAKDDTEPHNEHEFIVKCPTDSFCFFNPLDRTSSGSNLGFCCPRLQPDSGTVVCPIGEPLKVDICDSDADSSLASGEDQPAVVPNGRSSCPPLTHLCVYAANSTTPACCPSPCATQLSAIAINGRCYETLAPGRACKFDAQCGRHAVCQADKGKTTCVCKSGYTLNDIYCEKND